MKTTADISYDYVTTTKDLSLLENEENDYLAFECNDKNCYKVLPEGTRVLAVCPSAENPQNVVCIYENNVIRIGCEWISYNVKI